MHSKWSAYKKEKKACKLFLYTDINICQFLLGCSIHIKDRACGAGRGGVRHILHAWITHGVCMAISIRVCLCETHTVDPLFKRTSFLSSLRQSQLGPRCWHKHTLHLADTNCQVSTQRKLYGEEKKTMKQTHENYLMLIIKSYLIL